VFSFLILALLLVLSVPLAACGNAGDNGNASDSVASSGVEATSSANSASQTDAAAGAQFPLGKTQIQALGGGLCGSPTYIAKELGYWEELGLDVELVSGTFAQNQSGLASGQFLVANGDFQFFPAVNEGLDLKVIGGLHEGCIKLLVPPNSSITSLADLRGKRIGVDEIGGTPWAVASVALAEAGINPAEDAHQVTWVPYDLTVLEEVAARGELDAIAAWDPFGTQAEQHGFTTLVDIGEGALFGGRYCCFLYASAQAVEQQPEQVKALLDGWYKAVEWISEHPEEAADIVTDSSNHEAYVSSEDKSLLVSLLKSYHYQGHHGSDNVGQAKDDVQYFAEKLTNTGYLPKDLDARQFAEDIWVDVSKL
jgi:NitT/TauT family transport system substrate-binding protein